MAVELKNQGNAALALGHYVDAYRLYSEAIELDEHNAVFFANRAQCAIKMEQHGTAISDATKAIELDPAYVKAYFRRGTAYCGIMDFKKAQQDFQTVVNKAPANASARQKLEECRKLARQKAFLAAIAVEDEPSVFEKIQFDAMSDEDGLGPLPLDNCDEMLAFTHKMVEHFRKEKRISRKKLYQLVKTAKELFAKEPTLTDLECAERHQITVCGDTHGQFYDLLNIFAINGWPSKTHTYLFNGDFVDRGSWSTEIALTLYALKVALPNNLYINRGNHETDNMNITYGFSGECKTKYGNETVFKAFSESFSALPLGSVIGSKYLVVHGGLFSKDSVSLEDIRKVDRHVHRQPGQDGIMMEILWTDPQPEMGRGPSKRGIGLQFGPDVTKRFCEANNLTAVIRSHEVRDEGYSVEHDGRLITVFSAPNYCDSQGNKGALVNIGSDMELKYKQFAAAPHPSVPPMAYASGLFR